MSKKISQFTGLGRGLIDSYLKNIPASKAKEKEDPNFRPSVTVHHSPVVLATKVYRPSTAISKFFSRQITGNRWQNPGNVKTVHLLYVDSVKTNKNEFILNEKELTKILYPDQKATTEYKRRSKLDANNLSKEKLSFFVIKKIDDKHWQISFMKQFLDDTRIDNNYQLLENDFIKKYGEIFKGRNKRLTKIELGGVLLLVHHILINRNHASYKDGKNHRLYFRTMIENGCFTQRLKRRNEFKTMREIMMKRFQILKKMEFIENLSFRKLGNGASGQVFWQNKRRWS